MGSFSMQYAHESWACFLASGLWSRRLTEPPRPCGGGDGTLRPPGAGTSPFRGGFVRRRPKGSLCGGSLLVCLSSLIRSPALAGRGGSVSRRDPNQAAGNCPPPFRRNQASRSPHAKRQPLFGRGGLGERRFSQRSGLSPRISPPQISSGGSAREGASLKEKPLPRIPLYKYTKEILAMGRWV